MAKAKKNKTLAPAVAEYKPSMSVEGPMAKRMHGLKPGAKVRMMVHGVVTETGINTYGKRQPTARVEIHRITDQMPRKGKP